ncbi:MAG: D-glycero-beta-D-manno-heptose-7-phosphate kinase, partial [Candidatus Krumholzibacteria bacterium]|nr:D-glycero-beta-D-manno-heptose-7-phosphate kinase [Candidatus Krumholzibacteria bacterium]
KLKENLDAFAGLPVMVLGDLMLDVYLSGPVDRISPEGPVPVVDIQRRESRLGGAANVARNIAALGGKPLLLSLIGEDEAASELREILNSRGIDPAHLISDSSRKTTLKTRILGSGQQVCRFDSEDRSALPAELLRRIEDKALELLPQCRALLLSDYGKGVLEDHLVNKLMMEAGRRNIPVIVDPKEGHFSAYEGADLVTPNRNEAAASFGLPIHNDADLETVGLGLLQRLKLRSLMITLGGDGIALFEPGQKLRKFPALARHVYDVTGAGDTVVSVLSLAMAAGIGLEEGARIANLAAGRVVAEVGTAVATAGDILSASLDISMGQTASEPARILRREEVASWAEEQREKGRRLVFTNGCFDVLHFGHLSLLLESARQGDLLILGLNSDRSVKRLKGPHRPVNGEEERARLLSHLIPVDAVVIFEEETPLNLIQELKPDVLVKGGEYSEDEIVGAGEVRSWGGEVIRFPMQEGYSSTDLIHRNEESGESR